MLNLQSLLANWRLQIMQLSQPKKLLPAEELAVAVRQCATAENLDEFVQLESYRGGIIEYCTIHGCRIISQERPELNLFVVLKKGEGFAKGRFLPYIYLPRTKFRLPQLVVDCSPTDTATAAGYARASELPYKIAEGSDYPQGALVVCLNADNTEAMGAGYANALPIAVSKNDVYIEDLGVLDTEYAESLVDFSRFG